MLKVSAQKKNEKESRIELSNFPKEAQVLLQQLPEGTKRIRFYKETDGDKTSYESKFKYKGHWYSLEFNPNGKLEDIEKKIKPSKIQKQQMLAIEDYLKNNFEKYDFIKIQEHYRYNGNMAVKVFMDRVISEKHQFQPSYEIIAYLKTDKKWLLKELTFDPTGTFIKARQLTVKSYEYILY
jgi:hypothetical protein